MPRRLEVLLTAAATSVAIAFLASAPYWPREAQPHALRPPAIEVAPAAPGGLASVRLGPSILDHLSPVPDLNLNLPDDIAVVAARRGINGETGLIPTAASITTFRLRATGDLVSVAAPTGVDPVRYIPGVPDSGVSVHGAVTQVTLSRGSTVLRWTENSVTYEISSRTLDAQHLALLANMLR